MDRTRELIENAKKQIELWKYSNCKITDEYRNFMLKLASGICPFCGSELLVINYETTPQEDCYKYACGHSLSKLTLSDTVNIQESVGMKLKRKGFGMLKRTFSGFKSSGDSKFTKGVNVEMTIDREHNEYHQVITDINTGEVTHEEHETLTEHSKK